MSPPAAGAVNKAFACNKRAHFQPKTVQLDLRGADEADARAPVETKAAAPNRAEKAKVSRKINGHLRN